MSRWLVGLLLAVMAVGAAPSTLFEVGLRDDAALLPPGRDRVLSERMRQLARDAEIELLVVLEHNGASVGDASAWLARWGEQHPDEPAPVKRAVLHLDLRRPKTSLAVSPPLEPLLPEQTRAALINSVIAPAVASRNTGTLGEAIEDVIRRIGRQAGVTVGPPPDPAGLTAAPEPVVAPPRPWLSPWLLVALPVGLFAVLVAGREGGAGTFGVALLLALLYGGLYLLLRFRPSWFVLLALAAAAPALLMLGSPPAPPRRRRRLVPVGGGFGVTALGGFGAGGFEE